jgi:cytochrome c553
MRISLIRTLSCAATVAVLFGAGEVGAEESKPAAASQPAAAVPQPAAAVPKPAAAVPKPAAVSQKEVQSKVAYCRTCHGLSAQGFIATVPIPRLAGQPPEYIENQLQALKARRRVDPHMSNVARVLSPEMIKALSVQFKDLNPEPVQVGPKDLAPDGKKIFEEGIPESEVPPCSACHGDDAKGAGEFPRLAGQPNDYIIEELTEWNNLRGLDPANPDNAAIMAPIATKLTKHQIAVLAAYVSALK